MRIEPAGTADLPAILSLLRRCKLPVDGVDAHLDTALVARDDGDIVASAILEPYGPYALLRSVAVDETRRGTGLGQLVVAEAVALARRRGMRGLYLLTETAPRFFPKFGFRTVTRDEIPAEVKQSVEFHGAICASAQAMHLDLT